MSVVGLQSGLYKQLHDYAELVDEALLYLKSALPPSKDESCQKLGRLLIAISSGDWEEAPIHAFLFSVSNIEQSERQELGRIGQALLSDVVKPPDVGKLERLAELLEKKQSSVMSRTRKM
ncbi:MAG: hypothetical protein MOB07_06235 [Acidobacteria bacterium]|nr:hypothetical protein [Acidobacteriota bacterium]